MASEHLLLLVEGPHDLEFCARLLKPRGFRRMQQYAVLQNDYPFWKPLVPESWPQRGDLLARHPVPTFFRNGPGQSAAIINAEGLSKLATRLGTSLISLNRLPSAIGVILDADDGKAVPARFQELLAEIQARPEDEAKALQFPPAAGLVRAGPPRTGVFVMPDNVNTGTLEDLLLDAAGTCYPSLRTVAEHYTTAALALAELTAADREEADKPAGRKKAAAAAMASILKPGKAVQTSIQDNRWLDGGALALPRIAALANFLGELLD